MINLTQAKLQDVFRIDYTASEEVPFEIVSSGSWIKENSNELAINHAVHGNVFGAVIGGIDPLSTDNVHPLGWKIERIYPVPTEDKV